MAEAVVVMTPVLVETAVLMEAVAEEASEVLAEPGVLMAEMAVPVSLRRVRTFSAIQENRLSETPWRLIHSLFREI